MELSKKAIIVGCGGIGSFFISILDKLIQNNQTNEWEFECYDNDIVETKNILYQNFKPIDVDDYKVEALERNHVHIHKYSLIRVGKEEIAKCNLVILCVDNNIVRRQAWETWAERGIEFIDARSNGRTVGIFSSNTEDYLSTITDSTESQSCQYPYQLAKKEIELGNIIVASILSQKLINYIRYGRLPVDFMYNF